MFSLDSCKLTIILSLHQRWREVGRPPGQDPAGAHDGDCRVKIKFQGILTVEAALKAVEQNGDALCYVKDQTEAVCLKAVEQNGDALRYVKDQTEAVCLKAVEQNGDALRYVLDFKLFVKLTALLKIEISK